MAASSQENATNTRTSSSSPTEPPIPKLSDPFENDVPKPDGDPWEYFLNPMIEKDTIQCNAWKDEVQNILIFAGLFSAVVTSFIIESYRRLQPDPNDSIVALLATIAENLNGLSSNNTASVSPLLAEPSFVPSRSDISINVFWFISLVLSLTAALIGIVTLQWLREHQRYDNTLNSKQRTAILNARLHSLQKWYVPQIFAGLPLPLQASLVLFFAGMFEFLFALRLEVAIPVTVAISVPLVFITATTLLPTFQVCILQDPFGLAVNNEVPSPCPYKSPQSLIVRRISTSSRSVFKSLAYSVTFVYQCVATVIIFSRALAGHQLATLRSQAGQLQRRLRDDFPRLIGEIRNASGDWTAIDLAWLEVRTTYATSLSLQLTNRVEKPAPAKKKFLNLRPAFLRMSPFSRGTTLRPEVYDCTRSIFTIITGQKLGGANSDALYHCIKDLSAEPIDKFADLNLWSTEDHIDLCIAYGQLICYSAYLLQNMVTDYPTPLTAAFIEDVLQHREPTKSSESPPVDILRAAYMDTWVQHTRFQQWMEKNRSSATLWEQHERVATRLMLNRLQISPQRLFQMSSSEAWLPSWDWLGSKHGRWITEALSGYSRPITNLFRAFLDDCSKMDLNAPVTIRPAPVDETYGGIRAYMTVLTGAQDVQDTNSTLLHLANLCRASPNIIDDQPFLLLAVCFYLDSVSRRWHEERFEGFNELSGSIFKICGISPTNLEENTRWEGLNDAVDVIYRRWSAFRQPIYQTRGSDDPSAFNSGGLREV